LSRSSHFDDPIALPDGRKLRTLRDAGHYVAALPKATQSLPAWQLAAEMLLGAAERGGIVMLAEIAVRRALHGKPKPPEPRRKAAKKYRIVNENSLGLCRHQQGSRRRRSLEGSLPARTPLIGGS
jgi:hypothetical protein